MNQDDIETLVHCLACKGRGRALFTPCAECVGSGLVTVEQYARQKLTWPPKEKSNA